MSYDLTLFGQIVSCCNWRVTRSLVSYDLPHCYQTLLCEIEGSPDHWWVTTIHSTPIGISLVIEGSPDHWWVTTFKVIFIWIFNNWRVTRSLVSYDAFFADSDRFCSIEGSPDHWWVTTFYLLLKLKLLKIEGSPDHWWVTTKTLQSNKSLTSIEGSPDHWWVTTWPHHVIKQASYIEGSPDHWWVTTEDSRVV